MTQFVFIKINLSCSLPNIYVTALESTASRVVVAENTWLSGQCLSATQWRYADAVCRICLGLLCFVSPLHKFRITPCHRFVNLRQNQLKCIIPLKTKLNFGSVNFFLNFIKFTNKLDTWYTKPITGSVADWYWWCIAACARVAVQNDMRQAQ